MALEKKTVIDRIEISPQAGSVFLRLSKQIVDDGVILVSEPHRAELPVDAVGDQLAAIGDHLIALGYPPVSPAGIADVIALVAAAEANGMARVQPPPEPSIRRWRLPTMADAYTTNYNFTLPENAASSFTWGTKLNSNWASLDATLKAIADARLLKASNLSDLASPATARTNLGLGGAATMNVGTSAGTVAAGDDARLDGAAIKANNLSDLASAATARGNLGLGALATLSAIGDAQFSGALSIAKGGTGAADATGARAALGLGALATLGTVNNGNWNGAALSLGNGGTGATTAAGARTALGLGDLSTQNHPSAAQIRTGLGASAARVASGAAANSGRISWGTAAPGALDEGEIYLRFA